MGSYFDTHCHLQDERFNGGLDGVLDRARQAGVTHFACCGCSESDWDGVLALSRRHDGVLALLGLHPWYIRQASPRWLEDLEQRLKGERAGLGECGLDFAIEDADREGQERAFRLQLELAQALNRPLSIHCRKAWESLLAIARETGLPKAGAVLHSYSGSAELVPQLQELGFFFSFSCSLANPRNHRAAKALKAVPLDRLLFETDAPDIAPDDEINEPANIRLVAQAAAGYLDMDEKALSERVYGNSMKVFAR